MGVEHTFFGAFLQTTILSDWQETELIWNQTKPQRSTRTIPLWGAEGAYYVTLRMTRMHIPPSVWATETESWRCAPYIVLGGRSWWRSWRCSVVYSVLVFVPIIPRHAPKPQQLGIPGHLPRTVRSSRSQLMYAAWKAKF